MADPLTGHFNRGQRSSRAAPPGGVAVAPEPLAPRIIEPGPGATEVLPAEAAANRRHALKLVALAAVVPAVVVAAVLGVAVSWLIGLVAFVPGRRPGLRAVRMAPGVALRQRAAPLHERYDLRLFNVTEGLCATFGLRMPDLYVVYDAVPNACALGPRRHVGRPGRDLGSAGHHGPHRAQGVIARTGRT